MTPTSADPRTAARPVAARTAATLVALAALAACAGPPDPVVGVAAHVRPASIERDVTYATPDGTPLTLDAYLPRHGDEPVPAVVLVHGGAFVAGSKDTAGVVGMARRLQDHGVATFAVSYRLAPQHTYPAAVDDVAAAVAWLRDPAQAATYGVDPERVGVVGTSAGATLALTLGARPASVTGVRGVVALSAATLLTAEGLTLGATEPAEVRATLDYLGCPAVDECPVSEQASPALTTTPESSPALLVHGTAESIPLPHAERMAAALTAAGVAHDLVTVEGDAHGAHLLDEHVWSRVLEFLDTRLAPAPGA
ncbi:Alpha/beta hydrolase fold-3 domain protein [Cellulomonas flavigena DSM 20109]|uniref:Alpha/beta hydrolase fold-3 domain protein n=1 Tax=Cellulomonas flavigena (strain ATCC 482 / DSM 20109 / BCRC 11376 / JCM 18109 / NBRC 3775 / NCIMB 8073 / NRS 134) TaxID=446466 RepID=D5UJC7_CELFN|nr:alpha/beta hydrolase [Cellulomonas flavigena]ADG73650.1 Alpha/beta hydrolase fold-3 domain protein [Cellulomonas flavigena DSM 20109]